MKLAILSLIAISFIVAHPQGLYAQDLTNIQDDAGLDSFKNAWFKETFEKNPPEAFALYSSMVDSFAGSKWAAEALRRMVSMKIKSDELDQAKRYLEILKEGYPEYNKKAATLEKKINKKEKGDQNDEGIKRARRERQKANKEEKGNESIAERIDSGRDTKKKTQQDMDQNIRMLDDVMGRINNMREQGADDEADKVFKKTMLSFNSTGKDITPKKLAIRLMGQVLRKAKQAEKDGDLDAAAKLNRLLRGLRGELSRLSGNSKKKDDDSPGKPGDDESAPIRIKKAESQDESAPARKRRAGSKEGEDDATRKVREKVRKGRRDKSEKIVTPPVRKKDESSSSNRREKIQKRTEGV